MSGDLMTVLRAKVPEALAAAERQGIMNVLATNPLRDGEAGRDEQWGKVSFEHAGQSWVLHGNAYNSLSGTIWAYDPDLRAWVDTGLG